MVIVRSVFIVLPTLQGINFTLVMISAKIKQQPVPLHRHFPYYRSSSPPKVEEDLHVTSKTFHMVNYFSIGGPAVTRFRTGCGMLRISSESQKEMKRIGWRHVEGLLGISYFDYLEWLDNVPCSFLGLQVWFVFTGTMVDSMDSSMIFKAHPTVCLQAAMWVCYGLSQKQMPWNPMAYHHVPIFAR